MDHWKTAFLTLLAGTALAGEPLLTVEPRELRGLPGEPLRAELTIETADAKPARVLVSAVSNLVLRTIEKVPIQRTKDGRFIQKRIIIWQGIEAGATTVTNLAADIQGMTNVFPNIGITVDAVEPAQPPVKEETK